MTVVTAIPHSRHHVAHPSGTSEVPAKQVNPCATHELLCFASVRYLPTLISHHFSATVTFVFVTTFVLRSSLLLLYSLQNADHCQALTTTLLYSPSVRIR